MESLSATGSLVAELLGSLVLRSAVFVALIIMCGYHWLSHKGVCPACALGVIWSPAVLALDVLLVKLL